MAIQRGSRREKLALLLIDWLLRHTTSQKYQQQLERSIKLGWVKALELKAQQEALDAKLANEPSVDPISGETTDP